MKKNRLICTVILIIAGGYLMNLSAQEALKAITLKCENIDGIDCSVVKNKDKATKEVKTVVGTFRFSNNESLKKEILAAFEKDKDMSDQESIQKRNGRTTIVYHFGNSRYTYVEEPNGICTFSIFEGNLSTNITYTFPAIRYFQADTTSFSLTIPPYIPDTTAFSFTKALPLYSFTLDTTSSTNAKTQPFRIIPDTISSTNAERSLFRLIPENTPKNR